MRKMRCITLFVALLLLASCGTAAVEPSDASSAETSHVESMVPSEDNSQTSVQESVPENVSSEAVEEITEEPSVESSVEPSEERSEPSEIVPVEYSDKISKSLIEQMENAEEGEWILIIFDSSSAYEETNAWMERDASDEEMIERFDLTEAEQKSSTDRRRKIFQTLQWEINRDMVLEVLGYDSLEEVPADREVVLLKSFDCISMNMTVEEIHALAEHPKVSRIEFNMELEGSDFD